MSRMTQDIAKIYDEDNDEVETSMPQIKSMTKGAWAVFEVFANKPNATQIEAAKITGMSRAYISRIVNSTVYKQHIRKLRTATIENRIMDLAEKGLTRSIKIVEDKDSSDSVALDATKMAILAMGMGGGGRGGNNVNVRIDAGGGDSNPFGITRDMVNEARERRQEKILEGTFQEVPSEQDK